MDEDAVEIENGENVCRLCLSTDEPRSSVFEETDEREDTDVSLATKIQGCLSIQVSVRIGTLESAEGSRSERSSTVSQPNVTCPHDRADTRGGYVHARDNGSPAELEKSHN